MQYGFGIWLHKICYICNENTKDIHYDTDDTEHRKSGHNTQSIIPSLRKVLGQIKGVTVEKTIKAEASEDSKEAVLESIATAYKEVTEARRTGRKLPSLNSLIEELKVQ